MDAASCRVYWSRPSHARDRHREMFTDDELARAGAYRRPIDRDRFVVGCALTRLVLGETLSLPPGDVPLLRDCADCGRPHGRPRLADDAAYVSVSHAGELVAVAVTHAGPLGVDVERHDAGSLAVAESVLTEAEFIVLNGQMDRVTAFFTYWTRKEAVLKATGDGLRTPMTSVHVSPPDSPAALLAVGPRPGMRLLDLDAGAGHSAALAVMTGAELRVTNASGIRLLSI